MMDFISKNGVKNKTDIIPARRNLVYVAHPLRGMTDGYEERNKNLADNDRICRELLKAFPDVVPVSPLFSFAFHNGVNQEDVINCCYKLLSRCEEMWVFGDWEFSEGVMKEMFFALSQHIKVRLFSVYADAEACQEDCVIENLKDLSELITGRMSELEKMRRRAKSETKEILEKYEKLNECV